MIECQQKLAASARYFRRQNNIAATSDETGRN
jgi:hypothetical protein